MTSAYKKAIVAFSKDQDFTFYWILNFTTKDGEPTKEVSVNSGTFNKHEWGGWVIILVR